MNDTRIAGSTRKHIDWENPEAITVDGFSVAEIEEFVHEEVVLARCLNCGEHTSVEPDAVGYDCTNCLAEASITSPLVKLGLI